MVEAGPGTRHDGAVERGRIAERGEHAENTLAADHGDLHMLASREVHNQRDHAAVGQVGAPQRFADADEHEILHQVDGLEMRTDQLEIVRAQRGQESFGERAVDSKAVSCLTGKSGLWAACLMHVNKHEPRIIPWQEKIATGTICRSHGRQVLLAAKRTPSRGGYLSRRSCFALAA